MFLAENGLPVNIVRDGGDSSMRSGMLAVVGDPRAPDLRRFEVSPGLLCRNPEQPPKWTNPWNFTRDQLIPMVAGLKAQGHTEVIRRVFWKHARRLFFCQNFEEDGPGTKKPFPEYADPLAPNHIGAMIIAGRVYSFYWFLPLALLFFVIDLAIRNHNEQNQTIALCSIYGKWSFKLYRKLRPNWNELNFDYWRGQQQIEYAYLIEFYVESNGEL